MISSHFSPSHHILRQLLSTVIVDATRTAGTHVRCPKTARKTLSLSSRKKRLANQVLKSFERKRTTTQLLGWFIFAVAADIHHPPVEGEFNTKNPDDQCVSSLCVCPSFDVQHNFNGNARRRLVFCLPPFSHFERTRIFESAGWHGALPK